MSFSKTAKSLTTCIAVAPADGGRILQILPHFWVFSFAFITKIVISYDRNTFISIGQESAGFRLRAADLRRSAPNFQPFQPKDTFKYERHF